MNDAGHLNPNEIARYLDHGLSAEARDSVERHLDACDQCRAELGESARLSDSFTPVTTDIKRRAQSWRWIPAGISAAVAAAALLIFVINPYRPQKAPSLPAERGAYFGEGRAPIERISPAPNAITGARGLIFRWHTSPAALYRFTLLTQSGEPVFSVDTQDTVVSVPDSIVFTSGRNYFWRVDGTENGVVSSTGATPFHVR
jgi:hypothetical protein